MDGLRQWAVCLIIASVGGALTTVISPRGSMDKTLKAVAGIFVVAAICTPLADIGGFDFSFANDEMTQSYDYDTEERIISLYGDAISQKVLLLANDMGAQVVSVETDVSLDSDGCIIIHEIAVEVSSCDSKKKLAESLSESLGVTVNVDVK